MNTNHVGSLPGNSIRRARLSPARRPSRVETPEIGIAAGLTSVVFWKLCHNAFVSCSVAVRVSGASHPLKRTLELRGGLHK